MRAAPAAELLCRTALPQRGSLLLLVEARSGTELPPRAARLLEGGELPRQHTSMWVLLLIVPCTGWGLLLLHSGRALELLLPLMAATLQPAVLLLEVPRWQLME